MCFSLKLLNYWTPCDSKTQCKRNEVDEIIWGVGPFTPFSLPWLAMACHVLPGCQGAVLYEIVALRRPFEVLVRVSELSILYWTTWVGISLHIMSTVCCGVSVWLRIVKASNQLALVRKICEERFEILWSWSHEAEDVERCGKMWKDVERCGKMWRVRSKCTST